MLTNFRGGVAEGAELVFLILKEIGIDGAGADSVNLFEGLNLGDIADAVGEIPEDVQRECGGDTGEAIDLSCVGELFLDGGGGCCLHKLAEARAGVRKSPGGNLDLEAVKSLKGLGQIGGLRIGGVGGGGNRIHHGLYPEDIWRCSDTNEYDNEQPRKRNGIR